MLLKKGGGPAGTQQSNHQSRLFESNFHYDHDFESMLLTDPSNAAPWPPETDEAGSPAVSDGPSYDAHDRPANKMNLIAVRRDKFGVIAQASARWAIARELGFWSTAGGTIYAANRPLQ